MAIDVPGSNPNCVLCPAPVESPEHILSVCKATADVRQRLFPELLNTVLEVQPSCSILDGCSNSELTQFILDCTSINLDDSMKIPTHNPGIGKVFRISRDWCFAGSNRRARLITAQKKKNAS